MFSAFEKFTDNSPMSPGPPIIVKKCSARKSLRLFTEVLDVKKKAAVRRVGAARSKNKATRAGSMSWSRIKKRKVHTKINAQVKKYLYNWILQHSQALKSPLSNYCLKSSIDVHSEPHLVPKCLLKFSAQELHNRMVSLPEKVGLKEAIDVDNNIIISDSTL